MPQPKQSRDTVYRIPGAQDEEGNEGTLTVTVRKGGPDKVEFEPGAAQASQPDQPAGSPPEAAQLPADQEEGGPQVEHR